MNATHAAEYPFRARVVYRTILDVSQGSIGMMCSVVRFVQDKQLVILLLLVVACYATVNFPQYFFLCGFTFLTFHMCNCPELEIMAATRVHLLHVYTWEFLFLRKWHKSCKEHGVRRPGGNSCLVPNVVMAMEKITTAVQCSIGED